MPIRVAKVRQKNENRYFTAQKMQKRAKIPLVF